MPAKEFTSTKEHYVPRLHLRAWAHDEIIQVLDKPSGRQFSRNIMDVCSERSFYDDAELDQLTSEVRAFDNFFTLREPGWATLIQETLDSMRGGTFSTLSATSRVDLALFLGTQQLRTKRARAQAGDLMATVTKNEFLAHMRLTQPDIPIEETWFEMDADKRARLAAQLHLVTNEESRASMASIFFDRHWLFLQSPTPQEFYTSDHPIVECGEVTPEARSLAATLAVNAASTFQATGLFQRLPPALLTGMFTMAPIIAFPLAPDVLLVMLDRTKYTKGSSLDGHLQNVQDPTDLCFYNGLQVLQSHRQVYSSNGDFTQANQILSAQS